MKKYNEESSHLPVQSVLNVEEIDNWTKKKVYLGFSLKLLKNSLKDQVIRATCKIPVDHHGEDLNGN